MPAAFGIAVHFHFQAKPWDLYAAAGYTIVTFSVIVLLNVGSLIAILLVLFVPGYLFVAALFPTSGFAEHTKIDWVERVGLSFGLSIAIVSVLGLVLNFMPWGVRFVPGVVIMALFIFGVGCVAYVRRMKLPPERRLSATVDLRLPRWRLASDLGTVLTVALAASIILATATLGFVLLSPRPIERFTEFFVLAQGTNTTAYPTTLNISQTASLVLGIVNHELAEVKYTIQVDLIGIQFVINSTTGRNQAIETNRTTLSRIVVTSADGQNWTQPYTFSIDFAGLWKLQFLLYKNDVLSNHGLHLFVRVS